MFVRPGDGLGRIPGGLPSSGLPAPQLSDLMPLDLSFCRGTLGMVTPVLSLGLRGVLSQVGGARGGPLSNSTSWPFPAQGARLIPCFQPFRP